MIFVYYFTCPPLPHLIVGGKSLYRVGDLHLRRIMPSTFDLIFVTAGKLYLEENSQKYILKRRILDFATK